MSSITSKSLISTCDILESQFELSHATLLFILSLFKAITLSTCHFLLTNPMFCLDLDKKNIYMLHLQELLTRTIWIQDPHPSNLQLIKLIKSIASKFFLRHRNMSARSLPCNEWFDFDCKKLRANLVDKSLDLQSWLIMRRLYKNFVKSKK